MTKNTLLLPFCFVLLLPLLSACDSSPEVGKHRLEVTATAYTMREGETKKGNIGLAAWGDRLKPGMKAIAVSRDLIDMGLTHNTKVKIEGLGGSYRVLDKMNKRWEKKIDIFMGLDVEAAKEWGKKKITIHWTVPKPKQEGSD